MTMTEKRRQYSCKEIEIFSVYIETFEIRFWLAAASCVISNLLWRFNALTI